MEDEGEVLPVRRRSRWPRLLLGMLLLLAIALAGLWLVRKPLATRYADRFLAEKGVPARYQVADLGFGRQRLVNVVLGDPRNPDLVADWLEARTAVGLNGPYLIGVRGGRLRLRARWVDGRLSLGSLDRLLPPPSGKAFALPALDVAVQDARVRMETPYGIAGLRISGAGRLDNGFDGRVAMVSDRLGGACGARRAEAVLSVRSRAPFALARVPTVRLVGPARFAQADCGGVRVAAGQAGLKLELALGDRPSWTLDAQLRTGAVRHARAAADSVGGRIAVSGGQKISGSAALSAANARGLGIRAGQIGLNGSIVHDPARQVAFGYDGTVAVAAADARALLPRIDPAGLAGTPIEPLAAALNTALSRAAGAFGGEGQVNVTTGPLGTNASVATASLRSVSGTSVSLGDGGGLLWTSRAGLTGDGELRVAGGGLPAVTARLTQRTEGNLRGLVTIAPFAAGGARLAMEPVAFSRDANGFQLLTTATISGSFAGGRVDGLSLPVALRSGGGGLLLNPECAPLGWDRLVISSLVLAPGMLRLCPTGAALLGTGGGMSGGARIDAPRLIGRIGSTPVTLAAAGAVVRLADRGFTLDRVQTRIGQPGRVTRLDATSLEGRVVAGQIGGRFAGAGGQIGAVPLILSDAGGDWRFAGGTLTVGGGMMVSDAQVERPRFRPLPMRDVALTLRGNDIAAAGALFGPGAASARRVADVRLEHDLAGGTGGARFTVPGLRFDGGLQPDQLTPITFGVVADVRGSVTGEGRLDWTPAGVTSTGVFRTTGADLAAAFGPVEGIAGEIRFTDLLALRSAPGQRFTVRSVNPGIAVTDGVVTFQTLPDARVQVEGARWPFAGGELTLEPSLLDFAAQAQRRLTFRVRGMAADRFLQQFDFDNLNATGTFDGVLPMIFDQSGGRIENGRLTVRPGGGTIAYVGPITQKNIGFWPNLAFQALKSLRYRNLGITMNGPLAGEMVTEVRFAGVSQGEGAKRGGIVGLVVGRLQRLPFVFNIRITAPFRGLLDATASFYDPKRLVGRNLPLLLEEQEKRSRLPQPVIQPPIQPPIQPRASEVVP